METKTSLPQKISLILLGIFIAFFILEIVMRSGAYIFTLCREYRNNVSMKKKAMCRIMCIGESTTASDYPFFLETMLNDAGIGIKFNVINCGMPGITTSYIVSKIEENIKKYKPDIIVAMMGANDAGAYMPDEMRQILSPSPLRTFKLLRIITAGLKTLRFRHKAHDKIKEDVNLSVDDALQKKYTLDPAADEYIKSGQEYHRRGLLREAEEEFKKALSVDNKNKIAYLDLLWVYNDWAKYDEAGVYFEDLIKIDPLIPEAYFLMGIGYGKRKQYDLAEDMFKKAIHVSPAHDSSYLELYAIYLGQKRYADAEDILKKAVRSGIATERIYRALSGLCIEVKKGNEYASRAKEYGYAGLTINNYKKLWGILNRENIQLVCVQYPMRDIEPLKHIFEDTGGVVFVDNENIFKRAVYKEGYREYFIDLFSGDFGHCTRKGNVLLASHIANVILKELFGK